MNYLIIICISLIMLHFILYYLNIDPINLSSNNVQSIHRTCITDTKEIEESINELKKLNEYIVNEPRINAAC